MAITLLGQLVMHREHRLASRTEYITEPGKVYGTPHVYLDCLDCHETVLGEPLGQTKDELRARLVERRKTFKGRHEI